MIFYFFTARYIKQKFQMNKIYLYIVTQSLNIRYYLYILQIFLCLSHSNINFKC